MLDSIVCPISNVRINRNVVRVNGLITTLLLAVYVVTGWALIIVPIGLDYVLRAMMDAPMSPMARLATLVAKGLKIPYRAMDKAPKVFASRIGVCFAMGAAITHFVAPPVAPVLAGTLAVFTAMESLLDLCVGCVVYTYIALPLYRARDAVKRIPLFQELEDPMLVAIADGFASVDFAQGTKILSEGEPGSELYVITKGAVEVFHEDASGARSVVAKRERGSVFGEMSLLTGAPRVASVSALTDVTALALPKADLERVLEKYPKMKSILEKTAAERLAAERAASPG